MQEFGVLLQESTALDLLTLVDDNNNGEMELVEFIKLCWLCEAVDFRDLPLLLFCAFDANYDGYLQLAEFVRMIKVLNINISKLELEMAFTQLRDDQNRIG